MERNHGVSVVAIIRLMHLCSSHWHLLFFCLQQPHNRRVFPWSPGTHASRAVVDFPSHIFMSSPYTQSTLWCIFSTTSLLIKRRLPVNSQDTVPQMSYVHWTWTVSAGNCRLSVCKCLISSTANFLKYEVPLSTVVRLPGCHITSSL